MATNVTAYFFGAPYEPAEKRAKTIHGAQGGTVVGNSAVLLGNGKVERSITYSYTGSIVAVNAALTAAGFRLSASTVTQNTRTGVGVPIADSKWT